MLVRCMSGACAPTFNAEVVGDLIFAVMSVLLLAAAACAVSAMIHKRPYRCLYAVVLQWWDRSVLLRVQTFQPGFAGMHGKTACSGARHSIHEGC